jgi:YHS domain-containing protein
MFFGKVKDPVCGMKVKKKDATATSVHMGKTFYFCSEGCKRTFDSNPAEYMNMESTNSESTNSGGGCCH